jgi:hypothetical protein
MNQRRNLVGEAVRPIFFDNQYNQINRRIPQNIQSTSTQAPRSNIEMLNENESIRFNLQFNPYQPAEIPAMQQPMPLPYVQHYQNEGHSFPYYRIPPQMSIPPNFVHEARFYHPNQYDYQEPYNSYNRHYQIRPIILQEELHSMGSQQTRIVSSQIELTQAEINVVIRNREIHPRHPLDSPSAEPKKHKLNVKSKEVIKKEENFNNHLINKIPMQISPEGSFEQRLMKSDSHSMLSITTTDVFFTRIIS